MTYIGVSGTILALLFGFLDSYPQKSQENLVFPPQYLRMTKLAVSPPTTKAAE
jgi:hypothetical protein